MSSLDQYVQDLIPDTTSIPEERKIALDSLANYIHRSATALESAKLTFICTHNSRRSHMSQLWAAAAAAHYGLGDKVLTYSGGTESTAFNPRAVAAMERAGWQVESADGDNPRYKLRYAENSPALECFSKKYDDSYNPQSHFAAVMTCSHADENCPFVPGADYRISIPYEDPKASDGTAEESAVYDERCRQIAVEMFYLMARASSL